MTFIDVEDSAPHDRLRRASSFISKFLLPLFIVWLRGGVLRNSRHEASDCFQGQARGS